MAVAKRRETIGVMVGSVKVGGGAPVVVQSMTNTDTADPESTAKQIMELADAGSELVRVTVNVPKAAEAVAEIVRHIRDAGYTDKYRINPGNVGKGKARDEQFATICRVARDNGKPVRIGVNMGSLNEELVMSRMRENTERGFGKSSEEVMNDCMIVSALASTELALACGLSRNQIIISCKTSVPVYLIDLYRELAGKTGQPLHLGLTEAGMGMKGQVWSATAMGILLAEGIGDTIRVSLTPRPGGDRREEVHAAQEILQSLGFRQFAPSITACPGCGRTTSTTFQELAEETLAYVRERMPEWRRHYEGVETLKVAVMGCIVNGPGESKAANIGISLPGNGEAPACPVFVDGRRHATFTGSKEELAAQFRGLLEDYVTTRYALRRE